MKRALALITIAAALPMMADDTTWTGYMRAGAGRASSGGTMVNFALGNGHYRLGNETDNYGEIGWDKKLYDKDGTTFNVMAMLNWDPDITNNYTDTTTNGKGKTVSMEQMYAYAKGALGNSDAFKDAVIWAGQRFYNRYDVHMLDWKYLVNDGNGGGIENINLGFGKFAYAYLQDQNANTNSAVAIPTGVQNVTAIHHFRLDDIAVNPGGKLYFAMELHEASAYTGPNSATTSATKDDSNKNGGFAFTAMHTQEIMGGANHFVLQYANGAAWNMSGSNDPSKASGNKSWRFVDEIVIQPTKQFGMEGAVAYQNWKTDAGVKSTWMTIGARPKFGLTDHFAIEVEAGWVKTTQDQRDDYTMTKETVALSWSPTTEYFSRPEIRVYVTNAQWNDKAKGIIASPNFADKTSGTTYGVQSEIWW